MGDPRRLPAPIEVVLAFLRLGCTSFGGPIAHLGYFRAEFVERRGWLSEAAYAEIVGLAQSLPGPASSQVGFAIGVLRAGWLGGIAAWIGFTLPSAALMLAVAFGYSHSQGRTGAAILHGLQLVAVAVVSQAVVRMQRMLAPDVLRVSIALLGGLIALVAPPAYSTVLAIAVGTGSGLLLLRHASEMGQNTPSFEPRVSHRDAGIAAALFVVLLTASLLLVASRTIAAAVLASLYCTGALVFGGGHVVLPLLDAAIVQRGWLAQSSFLAGYGTAQAVPGPLFSIAAYIGASVRPNAHPLLLGIGALIALFLPGLLLMSALLPVWNALRSHPRVTAALRGVNASVVGVLAAALYRPLWTATIHTLTDFLIALAAFVLLIRFKLQPWIIVVGVSLVSILLASR